MNTSPRRVDPEAIKKMMESVSPEEAEARNLREYEQAERDHATFVAAFEQDRCYLCGKPLRTISAESPCLHWLLRLCKAKKKQIAEVLRMAGYHRTEAYLRWVANLERFQGNINDIAAERRDGKVIQLTIRWKDREWSFDCSPSDYEGHSGRETAFPHFHFQMRLGGQPFFDYSDAHVPFSEEDLFTLDMLRAAPDAFGRGHVQGGSGMQDALSLDPMDVVNHTTPVDDAEAAFHMSTMVMVPGGLSGDLLREIFDESKRTGVTVASLLHKKLGPDASVKTLVSRADSVPDIAGRSERKR